MGADCAASCRGAAEGGAWTVPAGASITAGAAGPNNNSITVDFGGTNGDITVVETNSNGCSASAVSLTINLQGCGLDAEFVADDVSICDGETVTFTNLSVGTTGATTYAWDFGANSTPATTTGIGPHVVTFNGSGNSTVSLTITDGASNVETKTDYITVNPLPTPTITGPTESCLNESGVFTTTLNADHSYAWVITGATASGAIDANTLTVDLDTAGTATVQVTETNDLTGCSTMSTIFNITVYDEPTIGEIQSNNKLTRR